MSCVSRHLVTGTGFPECASEGDMISMTGEVRSDRRPAAPNPALGPMGVRRTGGMSSDAALRANPHTRSC